MAHSSPPPYRDDLQRMAHQAGYGSLVELAQTAGVSEWQVLRLTWGLLSQVPMGVAVKVAIALGISLETLWETLGGTEQLLARPNTASDPLDQTVLAQEYERLKEQLQTQGETLAHQWQRQALQILEPWLLQWPAVVAATQNDPTFPARKLLPLTRPFQTLLAQWQVVAIAEVGETVPYDPRWHEWMGEGPPPASQIPVLIRYGGYRQGETLLYRAKVSHVPSA